MPMRTVSSPVRCTHSCSGVYLMPSGATGVPPSSSDSWTRRDHDRAMVPARLFARFADPQDDPHGSGHHHLRAARTAAVTWIRYSTPAHTYSAPPQQVKAYAMGLITPA